MTNVVSLSGAPVQGGRSEDVVEMLRDLLGKAEAGEISAVAFAYMAANGRGGTGFVAGARYALGGVILALQARYAAALLEDGE